MKEGPVTRSPHAFDPIRHILLTDEEKKAVYTRRVNDNPKPCTVIDVITKTYHRSFEDDLVMSIKSDREVMNYFKKSSDEWEVANCYVVRFRIIHPESVYNQPCQDFLVDIAAEASITFEEYKAGTVFSRYTVRKEIRLRYSFDLRPCELTCRFMGAITDARRSIINVNPMAFRLSKYLLPVLTKREDYERLAREFIIDFTAGVASNLSKHPEATIYQTFLMKYDKLESVGGQSKLGLDYRLDTRPSEMKYYLKAGNLLNSYTASDADDITSEAEAIKEASTHIELRNNQNLVTYLADSMNSNAVTLQVQYDMLQDSGCS